MIEDWVRYLILIGALIGIVTWLKVAKQLGSIYYVLVPVFWLILVVLFSAERLYLPNLFSVEVLNSWSLAIRAYGILTLLWIAWTILRSNFTWKP